jgi:uncharacterized repeat protein (TIGR02543 family)
MKIKKKKKKSITRKKYMRIVGLALGFFFLVFFVITFAVLVKVKSPCLAVPIVTKDGNKVMWNPVELANKYHIYIKNNDVEEIMTVNSTIFDLSEKLIPGETIIVSVQAVGEGIISALSDPQSFNVPIIDVPIIDVPIIELYTITLDVNGGIALDPIVQPTGTTLTLPTPTRTGFFFVGWYATASAVFWTIMPSENTTIYAKWNGFKDLSLNVEYNYGSGVVIGVYSQLDYEQSQDLFLNPHAVSTLALTNPSLYFQEVSEQMTILLDPSSTVNQKQTAVDFFGTDIIQYFYVKQANGSKTPIFLKNGVTPLVRNKMWSDYLYRHNGTTFVAVLANAGAQTYIGTTIPAGKYRTITKFSNTQDSIALLGILPGNTLCVDLIIIIDKKMYFQTVERAIAS